MRAIANIDSPQWFHVELRPGCHTAQKTNRLAPCSLVAARFFSQIN